MKSKLLLSALILLSPFSFLLSPCTAQVPMGFNYQAIARDGSGAILPNTALPVKIAIQTSTGTVIYEELFSSVVTNQFGLISLVVGTGVWQSGSAPSFSAIDWKAQTLLLKTTIRYPGLTWTVMGTSQIWSVPYSLLAKDVQNPLSKLGITGTTDNMDEALFEVKNKTGNTVFAVYNEGVRAYVGNGDAKGAKGGFSVGGYDGTKGIHDLLVVNSDSTRVYVDNNPATKGVRGGFSVGGYDMTKGGTPISNYLNVETENIIKIDPAENRLLWYPLKNSFMTGRVLIHKSDTVGENSFASGYESKGIGDWSQALGYKTVARGNYSTAIGNNTIANGLNSFSFGNGAKTVDHDSYALGTGALASGPQSFAIGSSRLNDSTGTIIHTVASGEGAFALGFGSVASGAGAFSIGVLDTASGPGSLAMGYYNKSLGWFSTTLGAGNIVESAGLMGLATGAWTKAGAFAASAFGDETNASGWQSFATGYKTIASGQLSSTFGDETVAQAWESMAIGRFNVISGSGTTWVTTDPIFAIGIGSSNTARANALTVYKNGNMDLAGTLNKTSIAQESIEINAGGTGNRFSLIDFHSDETYPDFSFRILRNTGVNGSTDIIHRGTGNLNLTTIENSPIVFSAWNAERMRIKSNGFVGINTSNPVYQLDVAGSANLNKGLSGYGALYVDGAEAIWYNGHYSWGYGGTFNAFNSPMTVGSTGSPGAYYLWVAGNAWSAGSFINGSDIRWKKNIEDLENVMDKISLLKGVTYEWKREDFPELHFDSGTQIGLIAQDVEKVYPELVKTDDQGYKGVNYEKLSVILLEGIKNQQKQIKSQQEQLDKLNNKVEQLENLVNQLISDKK